MKEEFLNTIQLHGLDLATAYDDCQLHILKSCDDAIREINEKPEDKKKILIDLSEAMHSKLISNIVHKTSQKQEIKSSNNSNLSYIATNTKPVHIPKSQYMIDEEKKKAEEKKVNKIIIIGSILLVGGVFAFASSENDTTKNCSLIFIVPGSLAIIGGNVYKNKSSIRAKINEAYESISSGFKFYTDVISNSFSNYFEPSYQKLGLLNELQDKID